MQAAAKPPEALIAQARAAHAVAAAARRYFDAPGEAEAALTRKTRLAAKNARAAVDAALESWPGPRGDWLTVGAALAEIADECGFAVEEHERFDARLGLVGRRLAEALEQAGAALIAAVSEPSEEALARAKNKALQIEDMRRMTRQKALEQPRLAVELSARAVLDRFSHAAAAVHRAADALAARSAERP